jgi:glyoxylase-like metal-dependent hydrolase (beta-lactamase superfamily II)
MRIEQIKLSKMATFCYLVGDEASGNAALIDPAFDVPRIVDMATRAGYTITHVINTHHHADHSAGNAEVIRRTHARLSIHAQDAAALTKIAGKAFARMLGGKGSPPPDRRLADGDRLRIGTVELRVLHTPGHTPGSICLHAPGHIFTGDTLFVGAVGRTDLPGGSARKLISSIRKKIYTLPEDTIVWPGHDYGERPSSTIFYEKNHNPYTR